jgi:hypothetical protein
MSPDEAIYDIGEVEPDRPGPVFQAAPSTPRPSRERREPQSRSRPQPQATGVRPALAGSLSMFVPGLGLMVSGEIAWGLFYLSGVGFCAASLWAVLATLDSLVRTLRLLDVPREALTVAVSSLALSTIVLHLSAVLHAQAEATSVREQPAPHPIVAGLASLAIPGWGQVLSSHRRRAALFLCGVWFFGMAWILVTPTGSRLLQRLGHTLPAALRDGWGPAVMLAAPAVLWVIAVYDAAAGAVAERRRGQDQW